MTLPAVIGVDAGGSKTDAVLVDQRGVIRSWRRGPGSNPQGIGLAAAAGVMGELVQPLLREAWSSGLRIVGVAYGLAGLDRPRDRPTFERMLDGFHPPELPRALFNDAVPVLRAGTPDGVGVAVIAGTGSNTVARDADGVVTQVGGLGFRFGDDGGGIDIGTAVLRAAFRGHDGRGPQTALTERVRAAYGLDRMDDLLDRFLPGASSRLSARVFAPMAFDAAADGDEVAREILRAAGDDLGLSATIAADRAFGPAVTPPLVLGGSVLQRGASPAFRDAIAARVRQTRPATRVTLIDAAPVVGAALLAFDTAGVDLAPEARAQLFGAAPPAPDNERTEA